MNTLRIVLLATALVLVGGVAAAPTASACGFYEHWEVGPLGAGLDCTAPYVEVFGHRVGPIPG